MAIWLYFSQKTHKIITVYYQLNQPVMWKNIFIESCLLSALIFGGFYLNATFLKDELYSDGRKAASYLSHISGYGTSPAIPAHISGLESTKEISPHISGFSSPSKVQQ